MRFEASGAVSLLFHAGIPIADRWRGAQVSLNRTVQHTVTLDPDEDHDRRGAVLALRGAVDGLALAPIARNGWRVVAAPCSYLAVLAAVA